MSSGCNKSRNSIKTNWESQNANFSKLYASLILISQGRSQGYLYSVFILCHISVDTVLCIAVYNNSVRVWLVHFF